MKVTKSMFKLSVISDEISQDFQRVVDVCQEYGVPQVEPRSVWDTPPHKLSDEQLRAKTDEFKARIEQARKERGYNDLTAKARELESDLRADDAKIERRINHGTRRLEINPSPEIISTKPDEGNLRARRSELALLHQRPGAAFIQPLAL